MPGSGPIPFDGYYSPIKYKGQLIFERLRIEKRQFEFRIKKILPFIENKSVLDLGTNSGYILFEILKLSNPKYCLGLDINEEILKLPRKQAELEGYKNIDFLSSNFLTDENFEKLDSFDVVLYLSMHNIAQKTFEKAVDKAWEKTKEILIIEPTNKQKLNEEQIIKIYTKFFEKYGKVSYLGSTDFENRGLFAITK